MKKLILIGIFSLFVGTFTGQAQSNPPIKIGIRGGAGTARFIENGVTNNFLFSYQAGLAVEHKLTPRYSLGYELLYSRQGNMSYFSNPGFYTKVRTRYDYLTLPVSLRYRLPNSLLTLSPGVQLGYLLAGQVDFLPKSGYTNSENSILQKVDYGFSIGLGMALGKRLFTEIKYYQSLHSALKTFVGVDPLTGLAITKASPERYNQVVSATLTYYPFVR
ncbi:porin family protein [Spirosoma endophyticum]|uniref:Outer membrane protein beta-barrel domain-containing protein n=1 Tax=Spirosoma endophyticum TaxID=662367 RepID=A0A1I1VIJ7_9BACT|nr:porin family protein [Spirosoma endophyticum]SFD80280.1 Outer membrane protein beta-barrel domain-containing protein [Spirosoma endophyticum]